MSGHGLPCGGRGPAARGGVETGTAGAAGAGAIEPAAPAELIEVWWARRRDASERLVELLPPDERARLAAMRRVADRQRSLVGFVLARVILAAQLGLAPGEVPIVRDCRRCAGRGQPYPGPVQPHSRPRPPHGKPRLPDGDRSGLEFSVAHSGDWVVFALARRTPVGVDVEEAQPGFDTAILAPQVLSAAEQRELAGLAPGARTAAFFAYWTRKEAIVKATGDGLAQPLATVVTAPRGFLADLYAPPGYAAAIAVLGASDAVVVELDGAALLPR